MDFLGFLEEKRNFLEFLIKRKPFPSDRPHGIPGSQLRPGSPVARGGGLASHWPAAADPAAAGAAGRGVGLCAAGAVRGGPHQIPRICLRPRACVGARACRA
jgi:hypothetical protein